MHIIFGYVAHQQVPILKILKYFKFEVCYLYIRAESDIKKNENAAKLKKKYNNNFEELLERSKSLLFDSSSKLKDEITKLHKTIYFVKEKGNIKNKIIGNLENLLNST